MKVTTEIKAGFLDVAVARVNVSQRANATAISANIGSGNVSFGGATSAAEAIAANSSNNVALAVA